MMEKLIIFSDNEMLGLWQAHGFTVLMSGNEMMVF